MRKKSHATGFKLHVIDSAKIFGARIGALKFEVRENKPLKKICETAQYTNNNEVTF